MPLRLQIAVEAKTPKYLAAAANDVIAKVLNGEMSGEVIRPDRHAWFNIERVAEELIQAPEPVAPVVPVAPVGVPVAVVVEPVEPVEPVVVDASDEDLVEDSADPAGPVDFIPGE